MLIHDSVEKVDFWCGFDKIGPGMVDSGPQCRLEQRMLRLETGMDSGEVSFRRRLKWQSAPEAPTPVLVIGATSGDWISGSPTD